MGNSVSNANFGVIVGGSNPIGETSVSLIGGVGFVETVTSPQLLAQTRIKSGEIQFEKSIGFKNPIGGAYAMGKTSRELWGYDTNLVVKYIIKLECAA